MYRYRRRANLTAQINGAMIGQKLRMDKQNENKGVL